MYLISYIPWTFLLFLYTMVTMNFSVIHTVLVIDKYVLYTLCFSMLLAKAYFVSTDNIPPNIPHSIIYVANEAMLSKSKLLSKDTRIKDVFVSGLMILCAAGIVMCILAVSRRQYCNSLSTYI